VGRTPNTCRPSAIARPAAGGAEDGFGRIRSLVVPRCVALSIRHSRVGGNPASAQSGPGVWIPAYAGMTGVLRVRWSQPPPTNGCTRWFRACVPQVGGRPPGDIARFRPAILHVGRALCEFGAPATTVRRTHRGVLQTTPERFLRFSGFSGYLQNEMIGNTHSPVKWRSHSATGTSHHHGRLAGGQPASGNFDARRNVPVNDVITATEDCGLRADRDYLSRNTAPLRRGLRCGTERGATQSAVGACRRPAGGGRCRPAGGSPSRNCWW
jgi:hypothetical protein